jgi:peptidyl-prolyl cis-trans isomerase B (cyclophilin B)
VERSLAKYGALVASIAMLFGCGDSSRTPESAPSFDKVTVQSAESNRAVVVWHTSLPTDGEVVFGTQGDQLDMKAQVRAMTTVHRTVIGDLEPETTYHFRIRARSTDGITAESDVMEFTTAPAQPALASTPDESYDVAVITTKFGEIVVRFLEDLAPGHSANFKKLARQGFYNGTTFHRVIPGFMIQGGDPNSKNDDRSDDGRGGPGYTIPAEIAARHPRGALAAARTGGPMNPQMRSSGSQFYITVAPTPNLDGQYTVYGHVISGMDVADKIVAVPREPSPSDNPYDRVEMSVEIRTIAAGAQQ